MKGAGLSIYLMMFAYPIEASDVALNAVQLKDACTRADEAWVSFCNGYAQAAVDFSDLSQTACVPTGVTRSEIVGLVDRTVFDKITSGEIPQESPAFAIVVAVLNSAYPCPK
jgi:hypothetical protein